MTKMISFAELTALESVAKAANDSDNMMMVYPDIILATILRARTQQKLLEQLTRTKRNTL